MSCMGGELERSLPHSSATWRAHAGGLDLVYLIAYLPKNGSVGFPLVFKLSFIQKYSFGMSNLCLPGLPGAGGFQSSPTTAGSTLQKMGTALVHS